MNLTTRRFLGYTMMPQVVPRLRNLVQSGFSFVSYAMACVFEAARLLPRNHPYINPVNFGKFGIHHVLAQAMMNIKFSRKNIDQIIIFCLILGGVILLAAQIGLMVLALFSGAAHANPMPTDFLGFFESPDPTNDISFILLDHIFGIPDLFNSCVAQNVPCFNNTASGGVFPEPYHIALHDMLSFYSTGLLVVAVIILAYYVLSIVAEWSQTGSAFGRRFNRAWAPLRLVAALGLLVPITYGLNSAQFITLYIAKWGSGFATNGWNMFTSNLGTGTPLGDRNTLVALPQYPSPNDILQFFTVVHTCKEAYARVYRDNPVEIEAYAVRTPRPGGTPQDSALPLLDALAAATGSGSPWNSLVEWADGGDVTIRFGEQDLDRYPSQRGGVKPYCGEITITNLGTQVPGAPVMASGSDILLYSYLVYYVDLPWLGNPGSFQDFARRIVDRSVQADENQASPIPTAAEMQLALDWYNANAASNLVQAAYDTQIADTDWTNEALKYGWAGAAIWYNKIAQVNGLFTAAVFNLPQPTLYPSLMEQIQEERRAQNADMSGKYRFSPNLTNGQRVELGDERNYQIAKAMNQAYSIWLDQTPGRQKETVNVFMDTVYSFFGLNGLFALRQNENIHPLASLASMGQAMITNAVKNLAWGAATGLYSKISKAPLASFAGNISGFMFSVALMGFAVGLVLYYVVPFLPFIYFFFAVTAWAKTVFEAMVGLPLWALAHLRYDGNGFPTQQSMYGYYLLVDIFIRPITIVFGLLGAILVFYASARTLNNTFDLVTSNLTGYDPDGVLKVPLGKMGSVQFKRGPLDQMFFTILYAMIVYMMGTSCFKMIDLIPDGIMRWMGAGAQSLASMMGGDKGGELLGKAMQSSKQLGSEVGGLSEGLVGRTVTAAERNVT